METNFYNTTKESGADLKKSKEKTFSQSEKILNFFEDNKGKSFTPFDVLKNVFGENTPITSIRRSMTDLERLGRLKKTKEQRVGLYGKMNYCWKLEIKEPFQRSLFI